MLIRLDSKVDSSFHAGTRYVAMIICVSAGVGMSTLTGSALL